MKIGANYLGEKRCEFLVWAPFRDNVELILSSSEKRILPMTRVANGYWEILVEDVQPASLYSYRLDEAIDRPDPASHFQPLGVHKASQVVDHGAYKWHDETWSGIPLQELIIYELHVGTFSPQGTFEAIIPRLVELQELGVNAIELMPVAQFAGARNWGYDGVFPFAVQTSYGGPAGLKRFVNACHRHGLCVVLDVVYNHLGPEGNYLRDFGPYFTKKYQTPWGEAINFDGTHSDEVRNFFIENALYWFHDYHIDALRLDAIHAIFDFSAKHFLQELVERVDAFSDQQGRRFYLIAESNLNDARVVRPRDLGGYGIDAQWCDDFHHALRTALREEREGYYVDFRGVEHLEKAFEQGFVYTGQYSQFRKRRHGNDASDRPAQQFVVCSQNHDQVGNRMLGERLATLVPFEALKLAASTVLLSSYIPLLFMGEEYGEEAPFLYFVDHTDQHLIEAVREGRKAEFRSFEWQVNPADPKSEETFLRSKLKRPSDRDKKQRTLHEFYRELIRHRRRIPALVNLDNKNLETVSLADEKLLLIHRWQEKSRTFYALNFSNEEVKFQFPFTERQWRKILDSSEERWLGPGTSLPTKLQKAMEFAIRPLSCALYESSG